MGKFTGCDKLGLLLKGLELGQDIRYTKEGIIVRMGTDTGPSMAGLMFGDFGTPALPNVRDAMKRLEEAERKPRQAARMITVYKPPSMGPSIGSIMGGSFGISALPSVHYALKQLEEQDRKIREAGILLGRSMNYSPINLMHEYWLPDAKEIRIIEDSDLKSWESARFIPKSKSGVAPDDMKRVRLRAKRKKRK